MGYETRLYIGNEYEFQLEGTGKTIGMIAMVDLSKAGSSSHTGQLLTQARFALKAGEDVDTFAFYAEDGNTRVTEDRYDEKLTAVDMDELIAALELDQADVPYRRFTIALATLRAIRDDPAWDYDRSQLRVVQFGY